MYHIPQDRKRLYISYIDTGCVTSQLNDGFCINDATRWLHRLSFNSLGIQQVLSFIQIFNHSTNIKMVWKLYLLQFSSNWHSLRDSCLTNHSHPSECPLHAWLQSEQSHAAVRLCTSYNMPLSACGLRRQTIFSGTTGRVHYQTTGLTGWNNCELVN